jgi:hypothetical protein
MYNRVNSDPMLLDFRSETDFAAGHFANCERIDLKQSDQELNTSVNEQIESMKGQIDPEYLEMAREMTAHTGGTWTIPNDTLVPESNYSLPEKIILLVNGVCKSSTEDFILALKPGKRVILAGERTGGVADFEETVDVNLPCSSLILYHPIGISNRLPLQPIDGIGIVPDIILHSRSKAWQPWVREVLKEIGSFKR